MSKRGMDLTKLAGEFGLLVTQGRFTHTHTHARIHLSRALFYPRYSPLPCDDAVFPKSARRTLDFFRTPPRNTVEPSPLYTGSCVSLSSVIVPGGYIHFFLIFAHAKVDSCARQSLAFVVFFVFRFGLANLIFS
jgi:hypothetical protein